MSQDNYRVHNIYRYTRKSYKENRNCPQDCTLENSEEDVTAYHAEHSREDVEFEDHSPRSDNYALVSPGCLYESDTQGDLNSILHKKCAVITLAQQQLDRVLDETNHILARFPEENCSRFIHSLWCFKRGIFRENKASYILLAICCVAFLAGVLLGAATCGTEYGSFNNPILHCIDSYFITDSISIEESFHGIT